MAHIRQPYLAYAELRTFIIASVCNSIILQANVFIDAVIVGNYVSTDAMAVINLFAPLLMLVTMVPMLLAEGSMVAGSHAFGERDYPQVNRTFMVNLAGGLLFSLAAALPISLFTPSLVGVFTDNARLYPLALDYLPAAAFIGVAFSIQNSYTVFLQLIGKARLVVRVTIAQMMINLVFDMLFIIVFGWGIQGAVYATICSYLLSLVMIVPEVRRQWRIFAPQSVLRSWFPSLTWHCGKLGLSNAIALFAEAIIFSGVNAAAQRLYGADGLIVVSVFMQMLSICSLVTMGVIFSMQSLGMTFMGENDLRGYRMVINRSLLIVIGSMVIISLAMGLFPDLLLSCFGADARLIDFARRPIVILSTSLLPFTLLFYYCSVYVTLNRVRLSMSVILSEPPFILATLWVMEHFFPGQFWWFFTLGVVIALAVCLATAWIISRRNPLIDRFTLAPRFISAPCLDYSLNYDEQEARSAFRDILKYIDICELSKGESNRIAVCAEEIMNCVVDMEGSERKSPHHFFDIRIMEIIDDEKSQPRGIQIFVKWRGKSVNPICDPALNPDQMMADRSLSLLLVNKLCDDIDYNYRNGVNCVSMKFVN
jgi:Na+-driven multidrug efflux pump